MAITPNRNAVENEITTTILLMGNPIVRKPRDAIVIERHINVWLEFLSLFAIKTSYKERKMPGFKLGRTLRRIAHNLTNSESQTDALCLDICCRLERIEAAILGKDPDKVGILKLHEEDVTDEIRESENFIG